MIMLFEVIYGILLGGEMKMVDYSKIISSSSIYIDPHIHRDPLINRGS